MRCWQRKSFTLIYFAALDFRRLNSRRVLRGMTEPSSKGRTGGLAMSSRHTGTFKGQGVSIQIETVQEVRVLVLETRSGGK